ncbi:DUF3892 domain-containing protein [Shewanella fodinae]|uniref:DUF3892 domain-containing protein n=1 Tax=Shewanella fodinae TaxID=552357 RepID=UPI00167AA54A|nr:DUF3892 domain-containing protein [Shewanella fodinae]MCL2905134.1 DUF3892 domain-containing protein [Shewanella fodinae]GGY88308.1 hypothetical protein GCM10007169_01900 [Shewanella fodinae]
MAKWADYLISAVRYNSDHTHIDQVRAHEDTGDSVGEGKVYARQTIVDAIKNGTTFVTIYKNSSGNYDKGQKVYVITVKGVGYLKTVDNGKEEDNLENLPEF